MVADTKKTNSQSKNAKTNEQKPARPPVAPEADLIPSEENDDGSIKISENVIAAVVRKYTLEVDGVIRFASSTIVGGLAEMIGRRNQEGSVAVQIEGEAVNIVVTLILQFGVKVPEIASLVQDVIRSRVEELTGKYVTSVDVIVQDLEDVTEEKEQAADENTQ